MARFLSGLISGGIVFGGLAAVASLLSPPPGLVVTQSARPIPVVLVPAAPEPVAEVVVQTAPVAPTQSGAEAQAAVTEATQTQPAPATEAPAAVAVVVPETEVSVPEAEEVTVATLTIAEAPTAPVADAGPQNGRDIPLPPLAAYATPFDPTPGAPLVSVVLIDEGTMSDIASMSDIPYPLTVALNPDNPDASERMEAYRAAGVEVVMLVDLPGATAEEVAAQLDVWTLELPEAVALLESPAMGAQTSRAATDALAMVARARGLGLITQSRDLNTGIRVAEQEGVAAGVVFRDFDGAGQSDVVMKRFLNQAAYRARNEGRVIMLGRVRGDTVGAVLSWSLAERGEDVQMAPASSVLTLGVSG